MYFDREKRPAHEMEFASLSLSSSQQEVYDEEEEEDVRRNRHRSDSSFGDDVEFDFLKVPKLPRSSSLKLSKTPPGTPTRRKSVRFADALGLDLALVRHILNPDEPPTVPPGVTAAHQQHHPDDATDGRPRRVSSHWRLCFPQPGLDVRRRTVDSKVQLESCVVSGSNRRVYGTVRVANVAYEKDVRVRYTTNGWLTFDDVIASYVEHSNDLVTDRFSFVLSIADHLGPRSRLEFAVRYSVGRETFWDSNSKRNYAIECVELYEDNFFGRASTVA